MYSKHCFVQQHDQMPANAIAIQALNNWLKTLLRTFALRMRFFKTFSLQFVRVWAGIPSLSGMSQSLSCSMTSKHFYKVLVLYLSFSLKLTKRVEVAEQIV